MNGWYDTSLQKKMISFFECEESQQTLKVNAIGGAGVFFAAVGHRLRPETGKLLAALKSRFGVLHHSRRLVLEAVPTVLGIIVRATR